MKLTAEKLNELHRLPDVRNALLDYKDDPCDDTALPLMKVVAEKVLAFVSPQCNAETKDVSQQANATDLLTAIHRLLACNIEESANVPGSPGAIKAARAAIAAATGAAS